MKTVSFNAKYFVIICFVVNLFTYNIYAQSALTVGFVSVTADYQKIHIIVLRTNEIKATQFIYYRADDNSTQYREIGRSSSNSFTDTNVETNKQSYCYKVSYVDDKGIQSEISQPFCSVYLSADGLNSIKWTPFSEIQSSEPVEYLIDLINEDGTINRLTSFKTRDLSAKIYDIDGVEAEIESFDKAIVRIRAIQLATFSLNNQIINNYPIAVYSNSFTIIPPPMIYIPMAFSPNGDRVNDVFLVKGKNISEYKLMIFDRWGNLIFESIDINEGWDGMLSDKITPCPMGNYAYKVMVKDKISRTIEKKGEVLLIK